MIIMSALTKHKEYMDKILEGNYDDKYRTTSNIWRAESDKEEMRDVMLEALFALYYEPINIQQWEADSINIFHRPR